MAFVHLGRKSFISQRALEEVLQWAKENPDVLADTGASRSNLKRQREQAIDIRTQYGPLLQHWKLTGKKGNTIAVDYLHPAAMLWHVVATCDGFSNVLKQLVEDRRPTPDTPFTLVLYCDEVTPGNQLKRDNRRKVQAVYWSILELGPKLLSNEVSWFFLTLVRTSTIELLADGMSQLAKECCKSFYAADSDFANGIQLRFVGEVYLHICAKIQMILGDEMALKQFFEFKGASGKVPCFCCKNVVLRRYAPSDMTALVYHDDVDISKTKPHSNQSIFRFARHLQAQSTVLSKGDFKELESNIGLNYCPHGVLYDPLLEQRLLPITSLCWDPMHIYFVAGLFQNEMTLLLNALATHGIKHGELHSFVSTFKWPAIVQSSGQSGNNVFQKKMEEGGFKCSAGEALALFPVVRLFLQLLPAERRKPTQEIMSFYALCEVLDSLRLANAGALAGAVLMDKIQTHLRHFKAVFVFLVLSIGFV